jgi:hypothetical protein
LAKIAKNQGIGTKAAAQILGVARETLQSWAAKGCPNLEVPVPGKNGLIRLWVIDDVRAWLTGREPGPGRPVGQQEPSPRAPEGATPDDLENADPRQINRALLLARVRKERALAVKHERAVQVLDGSYVHRDQVRELIANLFGMVKARLEVAPAKAARWASITSSAEMLVELRDWAREVEGDLMRGLGEYSPSA